MQRWALIAGAKGAGKSTTAARAAALLAERGVRVAGFNSTPRHHVASSWSHLRDLNSRPTVYEGEAVPNESDRLHGLKAQQRAYEALAELGAGGRALASALLADLVALGHPGASPALADAAAGRWGKAIDLLGELVREAAASRRSA